MHHERGGDDAGSGATVEGSLRCLDDADTAGAILVMAADIVEAGRPWSFDGDGVLPRLVSEVRSSDLLIGSIPASPPTLRESSR